MTAPVAKDRSDPSPGAPSPDHPVRGPPGLFTEVRRPSTCGTPRMTNLFLRSSKPSRFSRISPNSRISAGFSKFSFKSGLNSATNRDRKSTRLNSSHSQISYAVFCLKKKKKKIMYEFDTYIKDSS